MVGSSSRRISGSEAKARAIAARLLDFDKIVHLWREREGIQIYDADYDALVADPEGQSRALVAGAGLYWHSDCLSFYETARTKTLSVGQVSQPIYSKSSGAWQQFQTELRPLIEALEHGGWHGTERDHDTD